jgi:hypothetical protein
MTDLRRSRFITANFQDGCCDAIFVRDVHHHFDDPAAMNASLVMSLKPGDRPAW